MKEQYNTKEQMSDRCGALTTTFQTHASYFVHLPQCRSSLFVGDRNVSVLRHRLVPRDTTSPRSIHGQHRDGSVLAQRTGIVFPLANKI